jgi:non-homologous end joining protein Ku
MQEEIGRLRDAIEALIKRKVRKQRYIRAEETLIVSKVSDLIAELAGSYRDNSETPAKRVRAERRYRRCGETRHNSRTYKVEIEDIEDSDKSEE